MKTKHHKHLTNQRLSTRSEMGVINRANILNTVSVNDPVTAIFGLGNSNRGSVINKTNGLFGLPTPKFDHYTSGYTNVIKEAYGSRAKEAHSITFLRQSIEQRHQDIKNKLAGKN